MIDENVHFRHTGRLVNALVAARKEFELLIFPDERHLPRKPADRLYMEQRIVRFFIAGLGLDPDGDFGPKSGGQGRPPHRD
jgi:dipeptidyl-peptidase-4